MTGGERERGQMKKRKVEKLRRKCVRDTSER
jgi:hypothetical protein